MNMICWLLGFLLLSTLVSNHQIKVHRLQPLDVKGKTSTEIKLNLPFEKVFQFQTLLPNELQYFRVHPPNLDLQTKKIFTLPNSNIHTTLQELRTRSVVHYKSLIVFKEYAILHLLPNTIISLRESGNTFVLEQQYEIEDIEEGMQTKFYKMGKSNGILYVEGWDVLYLIKVNEYVKMKVNEGLKLAHLHPITENKFITAQYERGISIFQINQDNITKTNHFSIEDLKTQGESIQDISYDPQNKFIYILDSKSGIYSYKFNEEQHTVTQKQTIMKISGCQSMDHVSNELFVLTCSLTFPNFLVEVIRVKDRITKQFVYIKKNPIYSTCYFNDILVNGNYYLAFQNAEIDVFWSSIQTDLRQTQHVKNHMNFLGLQTFYLKGNYLYTVETGVLFKYKLSEINGGVYAYSSTPVSKAITIKVPNSCPKMEISNNHEIQPIDCVYEGVVNLSISETSTEDDQKKSASLGIILILIIVTFLLIWICLKKYRGLQQHAKKLLAAFKKREQEKKFSL